MKDKIVNLFRGRTGGLILCGLEIVVGVLLLVNPVGFTSGVIIGAGWVMVLLGAGCAARYFTTDAQEAAKAQLLFRGLLLGMAGIACITRYDWFLTAFPLLTVLYAAWMLVMAALKVQHMADMLRVKQGRWYIPGISAALSTVLAVVILMNPFGAASAVWIFVGVSLIAEAVVELVGTIFR